MDSNFTKAAVNSPTLPSDLLSIQFLAKVQQQAGLEDVYDARDVAEVVFRTMRDVMETEVVDRVTADLQSKIDTEVRNNTIKPSKNDLLSLWQDTNLLVRWLSRVRAPLEIQPETFLFRVQQEAGLSRGIAPEVAIEAVFRALKGELSDSSIQEIGQALPGAIRLIWNRA